jgi:hypothetical protein
LNGDLLSGKTYIGSYENLSRRLRDYYSSSYLSSEKFRNNNNNFTPVAIYRLRLKNSNKKMLKVLGAVSVVFFLPFVFDLSFLLDNDAWLIIFLHPDYVFFLLNIKRNYVEGSLTENSGLRPDYVTGFADARDVLLLLL